MLVFSIFLVRRRRSRRRRQLLSLLIQIKRKLKRRRKQKRKRGNLRGGARSALPVGRFTRCAFAFVMSLIHISEPTRPY